MPAGERYMATSLMTAVLTLFPWVAQGVRSKALETRQQHGAPGVADA